MSSATVKHVNRVVGFFDNFMGGIADVSKVEADDLRRFVVALQQKPKWGDRPQNKGESISGTSINTYVRGIKAFWSWLKREGIIKDDPLAFVPAPRLPKRLPKILTEDELAANDTLSIMEAPLLGEAKLHHAAPTELAN